MSAIAKTVVATGCSSGIGLELVKQLASQNQKYHFILGARNLEPAKAALDDLHLDRGGHALTLLPLELSNLRGVQNFAQQTLGKLGSDKIDFLVLNAAISNPADKPGPHGSKWCEPYIVNHLSQHYLTHLLEEKLVSSRSRIVTVSSGAVRGVQDPAVLSKDLLAESGATSQTVYGETKFVQLLGAHWWRRKLSGNCHVVAVSPGLIPTTGLFRGMGHKLPDNLPDAKSVPEGAASVLQALVRDDFPEDPAQIFLTSWGEWWGKDVIEKTLDQSLQDQWSPSKEQIEKEEGLAT